MQKYVIFNTNDENFGISIKNILTIEKISHITRVVNYPDFVSGVFNFRGSIIPVIDFQFFLGGDKLVHDEENKIIIVEVDLKKYGLLVNDVTNILDLDESKFEQVYEDIPLKLVNVEDKIILIPEIDEIIENEDFQKDYNDAIEKIKENQD